MTYSDDMLTKRKNDPFPRGSASPLQSPKYWAREKDRYLRQLLIRDIQEHTGRELFVYFARPDQAINYRDSDDLIEILSGIEGEKVDFLIHTPGGDVDTTEKLVCILRKKFQSKRAIVPSMAKSAGTVIALSANEIVLGLNSELGPIDPSFNGIPCEIMAKDETTLFPLREMARLAVERMRALAKSLLVQGTMKNKTPDEIENVLKKISGVEGYKSHGAVIDYDEAEELGLTVTYLPPDDELWKKIWLLYCLYDHDTREKNIGRIIEGTKLSIARPPIQTG